MNFKYSCARAVGPAVMGTERDGAMGVPSESGVQSPGRGSSVRKQGQVGFLQVCGAEEPE